MSSPLVRRGAAALAAAAFLVLVVALGAALAPQVLGYPTVVVTSGSMGDAVPIGSLAILAKRSAADVDVGDIVLVRHGGTATDVLHRVVAVEREGAAVVVTTKGDANPAPDSQPYTLPPEVSVEVTALPKLGYLVGFSKTPAGWFLLVVFPATVIGVLILRSLWAAPEPAQEPASEVAGTQAVGTAVQPLQDELDRASRELEIRAGWIDETEVALARREAALVQREAAAEAAERERAAQRAKAEQMAAELAARSADATAAAAGPPPSPEEAEHLLFVPRPGRYELELRIGPAPPPGTAVVLPGDGEGADCFVVAKVGPSPLPADRRRCAYLEETGGVLAPERPSKPAVERLGAP